MLPVYSELRRCLTWNGQMTEASACRSFSFTFLPFLLSWSNRLIPSDPSHGTFALITLYSASVFAWICLVLLRMLLRNLRASEVFTAENIRLLRGISWCCAAVALVFLISMLYFIPYFVVAAAAAFMMLIVRIVKNIFQQAADMKSDLDLTI